MDAFSEGGAMDAIWEAETRHVLQRITENDCNLFEVTVTTYYPNEFIPDHKDLRAYLSSGDDNGTGLIWIRGGNIKEGLGDILRHVSQSIRNKIKN